jgi:uncharacterized tellurite resistance protein B-like protein
MANQLPREAFLALAAIAWADGRMTPAEATGLVRAARTFGVEGDDLAAVEAATKTKTTLEAFDPATLSSWQRLLTFGLATWLARLDGAQQSAELAGLRALASRLESAEVTDHRLRASEAVATNIALLPGGRRPERYDFAAFEAELRARLPAVE